MITVDSGSRRNSLELEYEPLTSDSPPGSPRSSLSNSSLSDNESFINKFAQVQSADGVFSVSRLPSRRNSLSLGPESDNSEPKAFIGHWVHGRRPPQPGAVFHAYTEVPDANFLGSNSYICPHKGCGKVVTIRCLTKLSQLSPKKALLFGFVSLAMAAGLVALLVYLGPILAAGALAAWLANAFFSITAATALAYLYLAGKCFAIYSSRWGAKSESPSGEHNPDIREEMSNVENYKRLFSISQEDDE